MSERQQRQSLWQARKSIVAVAAAAVYADADVDVAAAAADAAADVVCAEARATVGFGERALQGSHARDRDRSAKIAGER